MRLMKPKMKYTRAFGAVSYSLAVSGGVVYVGSYDKKIYALDAATGTIKMELYHRRHRWFFSCCQ